MNADLILQATALPAAAQPADRLDEPVVVLDQLADPDGWLTTHGGRVNRLITHAMRGASSELLAALPNLELIANFGAGLERIALDDAHRRGIVVTASGDVLTDDVADLAMWQILTLLRGAARADAFVREGRWAQGPFPLGRSVRGRRLGILGFGRIGQAIAARAHASGMQVGYHSRRRVSAAEARHEADPAPLARWADILVVALPGGAATTGFVDAALLDALGPDGYLVNVARGSIVDEMALAAALKEERIAGAALDVFMDEPTPDRALLAAPGIVLTPHIGSATSDARLAMLMHVVGNVESHARKGPLQGIVAP